MTEDVESRGTSPLEPWRAVGAASLTICIGMMPVFLLGAVSPFLRTDLGVSATGLGLAAGAFYATSALGSPIGGRLIERVDPLLLARAIAVGMVTLGLLLPIAAGSWPVLFLTISATGFVNGLTQPAANMLLREHVTERSLDRTISMKQAAAPLAGAMVGLFVPFSATVVGWRFGLLLLAACALPMLVILPRGHARSVVVRTPVPVRRGRAPGLLLLSVAAAGASGSALTAAAFLVPSGVDRGMSVASAGALLTTLSMVNIATLLLSVRVAARWEGRANLSIIAAMMVTTVAGYGVLAHSHAVGPFVVGTLIVITVGWGWHALMHISIVTGRFGTPGLGTGAAMAGVFSGSSAVPMMFGLLLDVLGARAAWSALMIVTAISATSFATLARWSASGLLSR